MADGPRPLRLVDSAGTPVTPTERMAHVAICFLTRGICQSKFAFDLANLIGYSAATIVQEGVDLSLKCYYATYVGVGREDLTHEVLHDPSITHLLWLDDDMGFPKDALIQLLHRREPIVGANYPARLAPHWPTAVRRVYPADRCWPTPGQTGIEPVESLGFGCVLIQRQVFEKVPRPWFDLERHPQTLEVAGEDTGFCARAIDAGFQPMVDHDLSWQVLHCGSIELTMAHALAMRSTDRPPAVVEG
jgi:hypothetical protein